MSKFILAIMLTIVASHSFAKDVVHHNGKQYHLIEVEENHTGLEFNTDGEYETNYNDYTDITITPTLKFSDGFTLTSGLTADFSYTTGFEFTDVDDVSSAQNISKIGYGISYDVDDFTFSIEGGHDLNKNLTTGEFNINKKF